MRYSPKHPLSYFMIEETKYKLKKNGNPNLFDELLKNNQMNKLRQEMEKFSLNFFQDNKLTVYESSYWTLFSVGSYIRIIPYMIFSLNIG